MTDHRARILASAKAWIGTPYHDNASRRGAGCDCLGLIRGIWRDLHGPEPEAVHPYAPGWFLLDPRSLHDGMARHGEEIPAQDARPGDVILYAVKIGGPGQHLGVLVSGTFEAGEMIHAYAYKSPGAVTQTPIFPARLAKAAFVIPETI